MMTKKYLYTLLICLTIITVVVPRVLSSTDRICSYHPEAYQGLELTQLSQELTNTGLIGRIHGAAGKAQMFVMSVREPDNFFSHREFSLLANDQKTRDTLNQTNRHDRVCIQGNLIANPSPQKHIAVNSIRVLESWTQPEGFTPYERQTDIPDQLQDQTSLIGKVHAIGESGKILVMEYQDGVIPIFVTETKYTQDLYRGDIVKLSYQIQQRPQQPTHLQLDTTVEKPFEVIDAIAAWHNQAQTLTGNLVKFPQSPQLKFDVYAMEVDTKGIERYFTLVNFENITEFENIRHKLAKIWDDNAATAISGRNMLINPEVTIEADGVINIISPEQANPQILLDSAEQVQQRI
ncbi:MAG: hypothetical protein QNJ53_26190 [Pleurocapsa sp. MO_192.B19]|nr:hypothetical protein [Pleurocapsa sp. MO_192.B19]